jgi:arylsulfatase
LEAFRRFLGRFLRPTALPTTQVYDRELRRYVLSEAGTLVKPVSLSDDAELLEIEVQSAAANSTQRGRITLNLLGTGSGSKVTRQFPTFEEHGSNSVREEISVASLAGETCILWIDAEGDSDEMRLEITEPRIIERHVTVKDRRKKQLRAQGNDDRPDIVMITLDAARPHHFSCYGYDRPTTPNIDRLAAESLIFTNAFALVPNTRRSVPTMITGLSFLNHQVIRDDSTLSEAATTMAEYLVDAGYRTACFSASPNNSRVNANHQGYEEFFELWNEVPRDRSRVPHYLSARVLEWLTTVDNSRPLHLQLHFVPPHAPYAPAPEFDLFSDPLYDGECDGSPNTVLGIDKGSRAFDAADMKQLIALYDGNLRAADDAVEEVLSALRQRPRWRDTVVLVTSDHGEAFYEHRRMGHNNTVYDEMLRVPFILRLPGGGTPEDIDLDHLVTLADIAPTLLAAASQQPDTGFDGIDLVNTTRSRHGTDNRFFVARTGHVTPIRSIRTRRFKVILANSGQGELYDLEKDPGERRNLRFSRPEVFVGLGLILTRTLLEPPSLSGGARISEVPESDREMLEALGYIE